MAPERHGGHCCRALVGALVPCGVAGLVGRVVVLAAFWFFGHKTLECAFFGKENYIVVNKYHKKTLTFHEELAPKIDLFGVHLSTENNQLT